MPPFDEEAAAQILREEVAKAALAQAKTIVFDIVPVAAAFNSALAEAPRSTAILIAALIDSELTGYLSRQLYLWPALKSKLFDGQGPLSALNNKIDICVALNWIPEASWRDLHLIRKIRNEFAHNPAVHSFDQEPIASLVREMTPQLDLFERMQMNALMAAYKTDLKTRYLASSACVMHLFLRTMVVGPAAFQRIAGKAVYSPEFANMSPSEQSIIDWVMRYIKELNRIAGNFS